MKPDEKPQNKLDFWTTFPPVLISINMQLINSVKKVNTYNIIYNQIVFYKFPVLSFKNIFLEY